MLARIRKSMEEKDQGFTLIELLVVMIIIGILAAIAIPVFLNQRKKAVDSGIKSDIRTVATEVETAFVDAQTYPSPAAAATVTSDGFADSSTVAPDAHTTAGNTLQYKKLTDGFCVRGFAVGKGSADAATNAFYYNSTTGGLIATKQTSAAAAGC